MNMETDNEAPLPHNNGAKTERIDLGLAIFRAVAPPRATFSAEEIACWCDCTPAMISSIEARALRKMREKASSKFDIQIADTTDLRRWMALQFHS
jgi:hypothetical protein